MYKPNQGVEKRLPGTNPAGSQGRNLNSGLPCSHVISSIYFSLDKRPSNSQDVCSSLLFSYWTFDVRWAGSTGFIQWRFYLLYSTCCTYNLGQKELTISPLTNYFAVNDTRAMLISGEQRDQVAIQHCFFGGGE